MLEPLDADGPPVFGIEALGSHPSKLEGRNGLLVLLLGSKSVGGPRGVERRVRRGEPMLFERGVGLLEVGIGDGDTWSSDAEGMYSEPGRSGSVFAAESSVRGCSSS